MTAQNTVARQFWKWDAALRQADRLARQEQRRFTIRRTGTTNAGHPIWEVDEKRQP